MVSYKMVVCFIQRKKRENTSRTEVTFSCNLIMEGTDVLSHCHIRLDHQKQVIGPTHTQWGVITQAVNTRMGDCWEPCQNHTV